MINSLCKDSEDLFCWSKQKSDFYELWQQHKLLKTMEMCEVEPNTYDEGYTYQSQPEFAPKIQ